MVGDHRVKTVLGLGGNVLFDVGFVQLVDNHVEILGLH